MSSFRNRDTKIEMIEVAFPVEEATVLFERAFLPRGGSSSLGNFQGSDGSEGKLF